MISTLSLTPIHQRFPNWNYQESSSLLQRKIENMSMSMNDSTNQMIRQICSLQASTNYPSYIEYLDRLMDLIDIKDNQKIRVTKTGDFLIDSRSRLKRTFSKDSRYHTLDKIDEYIDEVKSTVNNPHTLSKIKNILNLVLNTLINSTYKNDSAFIIRAHKLLERESIKTYDYYFNNKHEFKAALGTVDEKINTKPNKFISSSNCSDLTNPPPPYTEKETVEVTYRYFGDKK